MRLVSLMVCLLFVGVATAGDRQPISLSVHDASPPIVQSGPSRSKIALSIHAHEEAEATTKSNRQPVALSIHDAKPIPEADTADTDAKPDCSPARQVNRVLVIYHEKPTTEVIREKVCDQFGCRFVTRTIQHRPEASERIVAELRKLAPRWRCGTEECDHFRLVNADDPANEKLARELDIKRSELPLLVKETDPHKRKRAAGMSGEEIAEIWNKWFLEPQTESTKAVVQTCVPSVGSFVGSPQWDYHGTGSLRDHLTDVRGLHHLPRAVVDRWSDSQVQAWHNWHHEAMRQPSRQASTRKTSSTSKPTTSLESRIKQLAIAQMQPRPAFGKPGDSPKKSRPLNASGNTLSGNAFADLSRGRYWPIISNAMDSSTRFRC